MDGTPTYNLFEVFADGGPMMYALVLCSLLALGVIIAKFYTFWVAHRESKKILQSVESLGREGRIDEALELAADTPGPVAAILLSGLRRLYEQRTTGRDIEQAVKTTGTIELGFLERGLPLLATVAKVAPLLGFLGTVAGMISAFGAIADAGQVETQLVAGGIKVALITTASGLVIAIPVSVAYNFFISRVDRLVLDMEEGSAAVLSLIWDLEKQGGLQLASVSGGASSPLRRRAGPDEASGTSSAPPE